MEENNSKDYNLAYLERQMHNLTKLVGINNIINSTLDIKKLLSLIMEIIKDIMDAEASTLLLYDEESEALVFKVALGEAGEELQEKYRVSLGQGIAGWVAQNRKPLNVLDAYTDERFDPNFDKKTGFKTKSILCTPLLFKGKLLGVIQAINSITKPHFDDEDVNLFKIFSNQAALAVQNAMFFQNALEEERIKIELQSAKSIHESLVPIYVNKINKINIAAKSVSAREVGGEFHGVYKISDDHVGVALVDIHQKGLPGGLQASIMSGALRSLVWTKGKNPSHLIKILNRIISDDLSSISNVSIFYGLVDCSENTLNYIKAGVVYPILVRNKVARYFRFDSKSFGTESSGIKKVKVKLQAGDMFVIITDGMLNIKNRNGVKLGLKDVMACLEGDFNKPEEVIEGVIDYTDNFYNGLEKREDISIVVFKVD
ncbi:PP2C family protein-serine/threonine phosphatase [Spirochaetota bacterium]